MNGITLAFAVSVPVAIAIAAAAFGLAWWSYRRTTPAVSRRRQWVLIALRTTGIGLLLLLLMEPILSFTSISVVPPSILVAIDESASMRLPGLDSMRTREAAAVLSRIEQSPLASAIHVLGFGDSTTPISLPLGSDTLRSDRIATRLDLPFASLADSLKRHNIRGVVLLTDGRMTAGSSPLYQAEELGLPVYAVGFGDSIEPRDIAVQSIMTNDVTYVATEVPVDVRLRSSGSAGGRTTITLRANGAVVASKDIEFSAGAAEQTVSFAFRPAREGVVRLRADAAPVAGELTVNNNARTTFVKVKPNRRRYVLIAGGPNADVAFVRRHLEADRSISVATYIGRGDGSFIEGDLTPSTFRDAASVVLIDFPTSSTPAEVLHVVRDGLASRDLSLLLLGGSRLDAAKLKALEPLLPVTIGTPRNGEMAVTSRLEDAGRESPVTKILAIERWNDLPPIYRSETPFTARSESQTLVSLHRPGSSLKEPLIVSRRSGSGRSVAVLGYGLYRWDLLGGESGPNTRDSMPSVLDAFVGNALRWLAASETDRRVRVAAEKRSYAADETVRIVGQVYDESYDPLSDARVVASVQGTGGAEKITLAPVGNGRYEATLGIRPAGEYTVAGTAFQGSRQIGTDAAGFTVGDLGPEFAQPFMNVDLLRNLAERTGGVFYTSRRAHNMIDDIRSNSQFQPRSIEQRSDHPLWRLPWVLAAALAAFATEWLIRKRSGLP